MSDDVTAVAQLVLHERQGRDRGWWQQMRTAFATDSTVRLSWFRGSGHDFVAASERMSGNGDKAVHRLSPPIVHVHGTRAMAEVSCGVEFQVEIDGVPAHLVSYTRLNYRLCKENGRWEIVALNAVYERDTLTPAFPGDRIAVGGAEVSGHRRSYALLTHYLRGKGYDVSDDLLGDDRPDEVEEFYRDLREWLVSPS